MSISVGIHLEYHDVHTTYLDGLLSTLNDDYAGSLHSTVPDVFKCPDEKKYGKLPIYYQR